MTQDIGFWALLSILSIVYVHIVYRIVSLQNLDNQFLKAYNNSNQPMIRPISKVEITHVHCKCSWFFVAF